MGNKYKRKTNRGSYGSEALNRALQAVNEGVPLIRASNNFGIPGRTSRRHRNKLVAEPVLPKEIELALHDHIRYMERHLYGLSTNDVRRLA
jgi:hypothetical protein